MAYSNDSEFTALESKSWQEFDEFFFDNIEIADRCGFFSVLENNPIGFVTWDPRNRPTRVIIGHNCIIPAYQGQGCGTKQMKEAINRITAIGTDEIVVSTGTIPLFLPARKMYESAGFKFRRKYRQDHLIAPELVEYSMSCDNIDR